MKSLKTISRVAVLTCASAALVAGGVFLGAGEPTEASAAPDAARYYSSDEIPAYPGAMEYPMGSDLAVNGAPIKLSYFQTKDSVDKVAGYYAEKFRRRGLKPQVQRLEDGGASVYALSRDGDRQLTVTVSTKDGLRTVFPGVIPVSGRILNGNAMKRDADVPFSPNAIGITDVTSGRENGSVMQYVEPYFDLNAGTGHIRDTLGRKGWNLDDFKLDATGDGKSSYMSMSRGSKHMTFTLRANDDAMGVSVLANILDTRDESQTYHDEAKEALP